MVVSNIIQNIKFKEDKNVENMIKILWCPF